MRQISGLCYIKNEPHTSAIAVHFHITINTYNAQYATEHLQQLIPTLVNFLNTLLFFTIYSKILLSMNKVFEYKKKFVNLNCDDLTDGTYIDDNSLLTYFNICNGVFSQEYKDRNWGAFMFNKPFEWSYEDFISFLLFVREKYSLEIRNITLGIDAFTSEYEGGDNIEYTWISELEFTEDDKHKETFDLFQRFIENRASEEDLKSAIIITRTHFNAKEEDIYAAKIFRNILSYLNFNITNDNEDIKRDLDNYLLMFEGDKLKRSRKNKYIYSSKIEYPENVYSYNKHREMLIQHLKELKESYGNNFILDNKFEDGFENIDEITRDYISERYINRKFLFIHILLLLNRKNIIHITSISNNWSFAEDRLYIHKAGVKIINLDHNIHNNAKANEVYFNERESKLYADDSIIKLVRGTDIYHAIKYFFERKNIHEECFYDEIIDILDKSKNLVDKNIYDNLLRFKSRLDKNNLSDLFIINSHSILLNKKYKLKSNDELRQLNDK